MARATSFRLGLFAAFGLAVTTGSLSAQEQERPPLPDYLKASIADSIERGRAYLQRTQQANGSWAEGGGSRFGYAALPALTLLECGVPANDPGIKRAADFIRANVTGSKDLVNTYEVALSILFLDRLGNPKDKFYIEVLAARLIASQTPTGGWGYTTQLLDAKDNAKILGLVRRLEPLPLHHLLAGRISGMDNPFVKREPVPSSELITKRTVTVPKELVLLPCFTQFGTFDLKEPEKPPPGVPFLSATDNSTTQFALLALWAARRHGIPVTRTGSMAFMRFHTCQAPNGAWGYPYAKGGSSGSPAMITTGLLGMAIGHGIVREMELQDDPPVDADPRILNGFKALAAHIGVPQDKTKDIPMPNLYFLWGLERVCMLYNIHLIADRDWYHWGSEALVANQEPEGNWFKKDGYPGAAPAIDTSFALMFLKRANLAKDLSAYLAFSPKKLNDGVVKLAPPPAPKPAVKEEPPPLVQTKPEPPKIEEKKSEPPVQVAEAKPPVVANAPPNVSPPSVTPPPQPPPAPAATSSGGSAWLVWIIVGVGGLLIVGGVLFFFLASGSKAENDENDEETDDDEDDRPRKKKKKGRG